MQFLHFIISITSFYLFFLYYVISIPRETSEKISIEPSISSVYKSPTRNLSFLINVSYIETKYFYISLSSSSKYSKVYGYISRNEYSPNNKNSYYKSPLYGDNIIIIPKTYYLPTRELYLNTNCELNCNFILFTNGYDIIPINDNQIISFTAQNEGDKYIFANYKDELLKKETIKNIFVFSQEDNEFNVDFVYYNGNDKMILTSKHIYNHAEAITFLSNEFGNCLDRSCYLLIEITVIKSNALITIKTETFDYGINIKPIEFNTPIYTLLNQNDKNCFSFPQVDNMKYTFSFYIEKDYKIEFLYKKKFYWEQYVSFIREQSLDIDENKEIIFKNEEASEKQVCFSYMNKSEQSNEMIPLTFFVYANHQFYESQPYISFLKNGYLYKKELEQGRNIYFRTSLSKSINSKDKFFVYIKLLLGVINIKTVVCDDFPFCHYHPDNNIAMVKENDKNRINNEYFFPLYNEEESEYSDKIISIDTIINLILIECLNSKGLSGCQYEIMIYSNEDDIIINPMKTRKISLFNQDQSIHNINFIIDDINTNKIIFSSYNYYFNTHFKFVKDFYTSNIDSYYNGNNQRIELINESSNPIYNSLVCSYILQSTSIKNDYVSFTIIKQINNSNPFHEYLWLNHDLTIMLSSSKRKKDLYLYYHSQQLTYERYNNIITQYSSINCQIQIKMQNFTKIFELSENNINFLFVKKPENEQQIMLKESKSIIINEDQCIIHFIGYIVEQYFDNSENIIRTNIGKILLQENSPHYNVLSNKKNMLNEVLLTTINYEYLIPIKLINENELIIDISFEGDQSLLLQYSFSEDAEEIKSEIVYYSRKIIIKPNIYTKKKFYIPKLYITLSMNTESSNSLMDHITYSIIVTSGKDDNNVSMYLPSNYQQSGLILNLKTNFYYTHLNHGDYGSIVLNHKKSSGILYAKIVTTNDRIKENNNVLHKSSTNLIFDINTNQILFDYQDTLHCSLDAQCQLIIAVIPNDENETKGTQYNSIYEYTIGVYKQNEKRISIIPFYLISNEYVQGTLYNITTNNEMIIYKYNVPYHVSKLQFEIKCDSCIVNAKINKNNDENKTIAYLREGKYEIKFSSIRKGYLTLVNEANDLYGKSIYISITCLKLDDIFYTTYQFKVIPLYQGEYEMILSEQNAICNTYSNSYCKYAMPIYMYDGLMEIIISISTLDDKTVNDSEMSVRLFEYSDYEYLYNERNVTNSCLSMSQKLKDNSNNNYFVVTSNMFSSKDLFITFIIHHSQKSEYNIFFTIDKKARYNLLTPNKQNLLYIRPKEIKRIHLPILHQTKEHKSKQFNNTIVTIHHLKGSGSLIINYFDHIKFDEMHSEIDIIYSGLDQRARYEMKGDSMLYFYTILKAKPYDNINIIKNGKVNYIVYPSNMLSSLMVYIYINKDSDNEGDITINFAIENPEKTKIEKLNWELNGFLLNDNYIEKRKADHTLNPEYHKSFYGYYDNLNAKGMIIVNRKDIIDYSTSFNKILLLRFSQKNKSQTNESNNNKTDNSNIIVKTLAMSSNGESYTLPQYEYFYSKIQNTNNPFNKYRLTKKNSKEDRMIIEFASCYGNAKFSLITIKDENIYVHSDIIKILEQKELYGKTKIKIELTNEIDSIYLIVYPNKSNKIIPEEEDSIYFVIRYHSYEEKEEDLEVDNVLNRTILDVHYQINNQNGEYIIRWNNISIINDVRYFIRIYKKKEIKNKNEINSICIHKKPLFSYKLEKKDLQIIIDNLPKDELYINLIAVINLFSKGEEIVAYNSLIINENKLIGKLLFIVFVTLGVGLFLFVLMIYLYKTVRKFQVKNIYKLMNKRSKPQSKTGKKNKTLPKNLSFLIESK